MNYLAHLYLGRRDDAFMLGNLLGDFVRGRLESLHLPGRVLDGIRVHRLVDVFTDSHPAFLRCKRQLPESRRRFAGIIVDICFDHVFSVEWERFTGGEPSLDQFVDRAYRILREREGLLPDRMREVLPYMIAEDWLTSYRTLDGLATTFERVSNRSPRLAPVAQGIEDLTADPSLYRDAFAEILPDLDRYVDHLERELPPH